MTGIVAFTDSNHLRHKYKTSRYSVLMSGQGSPIIFSSTLILHAAFPPQSLLTSLVFITGEQDSCVLDPSEHILGFEREYSAE